MNINEIKTPEDILEYMKKNIKYGWFDIYNKKHFKTLKQFRRLYRTASLEETIKSKMGCCVEQVLLMSYLLDQINIPNKMFCTRVYEGEDFNDLDSDEHLHCFVLYYQNDKVYHIEHPNWEHIGIFEYKDEETAIKEINKIYEEMVNGTARPVTEFKEIPTGLTFKELNLYINNLDKKREK